MKLVRLILIFCSALGAAQTYVTVPQTINSNWTEIGTAVGYAATGMTSCGANCYQYTPTQSGQAAYKVGDIGADWCDTDASSATGLDYTSIAVVDNILGQGTINTVNSGGNTAITSASGSTYTAGWVGGYVLIQSTAYLITGFTDGSHITASGNAGTLTGTPYSAGNKWTAASGTHALFTHGIGSLAGQFFYLSGSAFSFPADPGMPYTYGATCGITTNKTVNDFDISWSILRGLTVNATLNTFSGWSNNASAGTGIACGDTYLCYPIATTPAQNVSANDLLIMGGVWSGNTYWGPNTAWSFGGSVISLDQTLSASNEIATMLMASDDTAARTGATLTPYISGPSASTGTVGIVGVVALTGTTAAPPVFSLAGGTYNSSLPKSTTITSPTTSAVICFTTNGNTPTATVAGTCDSGSGIQSLSNGGSTNIPAYTGGAVTVKAIATLSGLINSTVAASSAYTINATLSKWDGTTVGSFSGNVSKLNGQTIGTASGNYGQWNGVVAPPPSFSISLAQAVVHSYPATSCTITGTVSGNNLVFTSVWNNASATPTVTTTSGSTGAWSTPIIKTSSLASTSVLFSTTTTNGGSVTAALSANQSDEGCTLAEYSRTPSGAFTVDGAGCGGEITGPTTIFTCSITTTQTDGIIAILGDEAGLSSIAACGNANGCTGIYPTLEGSSTAHADGYEDWLSSSAPCTSSCGGIPAGTYSVGFVTNSVLRTALNVVAVY